LRGEDPPHRLRNADRDENIQKLAGLDGILVPGGFGSRGIEGKIRAARFAERTRSPTSACALDADCHHRIALRRGGNDGANSTEFDDKTAFP
jgi:CTP synthase